MPLKIVLAALAALTIIAGPVLAQGNKTPAGYVVAVALAGEDKTAIVRDGQELVPKLMMPLYAGDIVFVRDPASRIGLEIGGGEKIEVVAAERFEVRGEIPTGEDAWSVIAAVVGILGGGEGEEIPENMVTRGEDGALQMPMAVRGPNFLVKGGRTLWLAWTGGAAPFKLIVDVDGRAQPFAGIAAREFELQIPAKAVDRFNVTIRDAAGGTARVVFRFRNALPEMPQALRDAGPGESVDALLLAAWLTTLHEGDWSVEAAQILRQRAGGDPAAAALLDRIVRGWKLN
jgi:hypothetical protein